MKLIRIYNKKGLFKEIKVEGLQYIKVDGLVCYDARFLKSLEFGVE